MDSVWGNSRKQTRAQGDSSVSAGGSKLVQLQRQSSTLSASGLPTLSTNSLSSVSPGPLSSSASSSSHGSGAIHPGLSAFLTGPSSSDLDSSPINSNSNISSNINSGKIGSSDYGVTGGNPRSAGPTGLSGYSATGVSYSGGSGGGGGGAQSTVAGTQQQPSLSTSAASSSLEIHPLHFNWVFWFMHRAPGSKILNYESSMKKIATFGSVEDFWAVYSHLRRPHELPHVSDYHLFKQGVRPVWEDATNINGGKWIVRLKKGLASRYWENLVMAVVGDQFEVGSEICGIVLSIRGAEDILSIWNQSANEGRINLKIRDTMKRVLNLPADTIMEYKTHNDALKDNSSFRNTDVFR
ncbi:Eukaryotic translation initiation factor 4E type 2 [Mortierella sp. AD094]|nr:Eukaryotic translation initiation factor 4E type 2 [Mortierella sp. AD094]